MIRAPPGEPTIEEGGMNHDYQQTEPLARMGNKEPVQ
jgi:hypothetical protein